MLIANNNRYQTGLGIIIVVAAMLLLAVTVIMIVTATAAVAAAEQQQQAQQQYQQQPFRFNNSQFSECITDVSAMFVEGYYAAHTDFRTGGPYNETLGAPPASQNYYYNMMTGEKIHDEGARNDYIQGYQLGWKDAQRGVYQVDC